VLPRTLEAHLRAAVALSSVPRFAPLDMAIGLATAEPSAAGESIAGVPALLMRPGRGSTWPALVLLNGVTARGRHHPQVQRLATGLARAGFLVCVPDPPGLARGPLAAATVAATNRVVTNVADRADVRGGQVGLVGVSIGATLALLAAEDPSLTGRISIVGGIAPHVDFVNAVRLATTADVPPLLPLLVARSLFAGLPPSDERAALLTQLDEVADDDPDPLQTVAGLHADRNVELVARLLSNRDPARFDRLYASLPADVQAEIQRLSPLSAAERLHAPVELAVGRDDKYLLVGESRALARAATNTHVRVTVTAALDHAVPKLSLSELDGLFQFDGWAVRVLEAAYTP